MTRRKRMAGGAIGLVVALVAVWAVFSLAANGQDGIPQLMPRIPSTPIAPGEQLPPLELPPDSGDDEILPAQFTTPPGTLPGTAQPPARPVADPPTPVVSIRVRVPADAPPGDDLKYTITVQNTSNAPAHGVTVRNPIPDGIEKPVSAEPAWEKDSTAKELTWKFGTLAPGKSKSIELTLRPKPGAAEVKNLAYVRFEHGEAVTTRLNKPAVRITKAAPQQSVRDEQFIVRIYVDNTGKVPAEKVRIAENVPATADLQPITKGGVRMAQPQGQQWVWEIPRIMPGERKLIEYRVTAREAKDVFALDQPLGRQGHSGQGRVDDARAGARPYRQAHRPRLERRGQPR